MQIIRLKNGTDEPKPIVTTTMALLRLLSEDGVEGAFALCDLLELCKDKNYDASYSKARLQELALLDLHGQPYSGTRNVVLSAVVLDRAAGTISIGDPRAADNFVQRVTSSRDDGGKEEKGI